MTRSAAIKTSAPGFPESGPRRRNEAVLGATPPRSLFGGLIGVIFAPHNDPQGGAPPWLETQNARADRNSHAGFHECGKTPADGFRSRDARWLGVQPAGQPEQPG